MLYHVLCVDIEDGKALRKRLRPAHLDYMIKHVDKIVFGGPLVDEDEVSNGSIMVMKFKDSAELSQFLDAEPYNVGGLFREVRVSNMLQMVPQRYAGFLKDEYRREAASYENRL